LLAGVGYDFPLVAMNPKHSTKILLLRECVVIAVVPHSIAYPLNYYYLVFPIFI
jgi:hypothetical protein